MILRHRLFYLALLSKFDHDFVQLKIGSEGLGVISIFKPDLLRSVEAARIPVYTENEDGLIGITFDPEFVTNGFIYLLYSPPAESVNQLSRFKVVADKIDLPSEKVVLKYATQRSLCCHTGGSMRWDDKGNLYISVGDNSSPFASDGFDPIDEIPGREGFDAQRSAGNTNDLRGKILRIKPTADGGYTIPAGNLFPPGTAKTRPEILSMGHRNPYRIGVDPEKGWVLIGEVGPDAGADKPGRGPAGHDEFNVVTKPGNFGWPYFIADNKPYDYYNFQTKTSGPPFNPLKPENHSPNNTGLTELPPAQPASIWYTYNSGTSTAGKAFPGLTGNGQRTALGGPYYRFSGTGPKTRMPPHLSGKFLVGEFSRRWFDVLALDDSGRVSDVQPIFRGMTFKEPIDMAFGPEGNLYVLEYGEGWFAANAGGGLYQIEYSGSCLLPVNAIARSAKRQSRLNGGLVPGLTLTRGIKVPPGYTRVQAYRVDGALAWERKVSGDEARGTVFAPAGLAEGLFKIIFQL